jgi:hypothetical protein
LINGGCFFRCALPGDCSRMLCDQLSCFVYDGYPGGLCANRLAPIANVDCTSSADCPIGMACLVNESTCHFPCLDD